MQPILMGQPITRIGGPTQMNKNQKIAKDLSNGHRIIDVMAKYKVSYAQVKGVKDELHGWDKVGVQIKLNTDEDVFCCSCGNDMFSHVYRTNEYKCNVCGGLYEGIKVSGSEAF